MDRTYFRRPDKPALYDQRLGSSWKTLKGKLSVDLFAVGSFVDAEDLLPPGGDPLDVGDRSAGFLGHSLSAGTDRAGAGMAGGSQRGNIQPDHIFCCF